MNSVVSYKERGIGGDNKYRGNCSPKLIEDIIKQFQIRNLNDYMVGSGTTEDVCRQLGIESSCYDLNRGFDLLNMDIKERPENIFWHPPYHNIVTYSDVMYRASTILEKYGFDPCKSDLSRCSSWDEFVKKMNVCMMKLFNALDSSGRVFVLMGDIKNKGVLYSMLCDIIKPGMLEQIVIKVQHNCCSDRTTYSGNFIKITHEYLMILKKVESLYFEVKYTQNFGRDVRDLINVTWKDVVAAVLDDSGKALTLNDIYNKISGHKKTLRNKHWKEKVRQTLQIYDMFISDSRGVWQLST